MLIAMPWFRLLLISIVAGMLAGALVLGIGGRLLMSGLVLLGGAQPRFSLGGSANVVLIGALYGAAGGVLLVPLRRASRRIRLPAGVLLGLVLFGLAWLTSRAGRGAAAGLGGRLPVAVVLAAGTFVTYGLLTTRLFARWSARHMTAVG
jgi:hypothetical protein